MRCDYCDKWFLLQTSKTAHEALCDVRIAQARARARQESSEDGDFATSALMGYATNNAMLGYMTGGSLSGALIGSALSPSDGYAAERDSITGHGGESGGGGSTNTWDSPSSSYSSPDSSSSSSYDSGSSSSDSGSSSSGGSD